MQNKKGEEKKRCDNILQQTDYIDDDYFQFQALALAGCCVAAFSFLFSIS